MFTTLCVHVPSPWRVADEAAVSENMPPFLAAVEAELTPEKWAALWRALCDRQRVVVRLAREEARRRRDQVRAPSAAATSPLSCLRIGDRWV